MKDFNALKEMHLDKLELYVPVVERVHGPSHPEFYEVRKIYDRLIDKIRNAGVEQAELAKEFEELRKVTNNYVVPEDVCESYEAVYNMLKDLDEAY
ncbi:MAG TPA: iron-sulfur cluster repair di-iron protein, ric [Natronincola sp.]|nr:iron-sulfur cluster repair di-iron protein, ric [Natronincola sp.]